MTETANQERKPLATICIYRDGSEVGCEWGAPAFDPVNLQTAREALLQMAEKLNEMNFRFLMKKAYESGERAAFGEEEDEDI